MSVGLGLIDRMIKEGLGVAILDEKGITPSMFRGKEETKVLAYVKKHFVKFGKLPTLKTIRSETKVQFPTFPDEPLNYWVAGVKSRRDSFVIADLSRKMQDAVSMGRMDEALNYVRGLYIEVGIQKYGSKIHQYSEVAREVLQRHDRLQLSTEISGISFGIPYVDQISGGAQPGDSIAIVGRPSAGKSYFLLQMCLSAFLTGKTPLLVTLEMPAVQCVRRMLSLRNNVTINMLRTGKLSYWARKKIEKDCEALALGKRLFPIFEGSLNSTVDDLILRVQETRPDALYIDGAYLLRIAGKPLARWERITECAEVIKGVSKDFDIPTLATYQFNRKGPGSLANIGGADAIGQLASIVLEIKDEGEDEDDSDLEVRSFSSPRTYKLLGVLKGREGERGQVRVIYDMSRMIIQQESVIQGYAVGDNLSEGEREDGRSRERR